MPRSIPRAIEFVISQSDCLALFLDRDCRGSPTKADRFWMGLICRHCAADAKAGAVRRHRDGLRHKLRAVILSSTTKRGRPLGLRPNPTLISYAFAHRKSHLTSICRLPRIEERQR